MMRAFKTFTGIVAPLDRANIDTDAIIPKQYLKSIRRTGFGAHLFDDWRYLDPGSLLIDNDRRRLNPDFILNQAAYKDARILLARDNFGCGSSREHAVWALMDYGFRAVIAPGYGDIFYSNAIKNGLLPVRLDDPLMDGLFAAARANSDYQLTIDLPAQRIIAPEGEGHRFNIDAGLKRRLIEGLDDIELTLAHADAIKAYERARAGTAPWLFPDAQ